MFLRYYNGGQAFVGPHLSHQKFTRKKRPIGPLSLTIAILLSGFAVWAIKVFMVGV